MKITIITVLLIYAQAYSQWQPDVRLTNDAGSSQTSLSNAWSIASSGNILHVVWEDNRDVNSEIYYKRSTNTGLTWGADTRLTNNVSVSNQASIAVTGLFVHVVWSDSRDGQYEIYYKRSTDAGLTWGADIRLSALDYFYSAIPSLAVSGSVVSVVWEDSRYGHGIFYKASSDGGASWGADKRLSDSAVYATARGEVSVAVSGLLVHTVWTDRRTDPNGEIYYKRSIDGGINWSADIRQTNNPNYSFAPSISVSGSNVHIVWTDNRDGFNQIYYKRSTDGGISWGSDTRLTYSVVNLYHANLSTSGSNLHIVWRNVTTGNTTIYYKRSTDGGGSWGSDLELINNSSHSVSPSVAVSGATVNVVWSDDRDGNYEVYYKRDTTGNPASTFQSQFNRNNLNKPITDNLNTLDTISIDYSSLTNFYVYDVNLKIDTVIHTNDSDLEFYLIHNGVTDTAIYQVGGTGDNFINTVLNDSASNPISGGTAPFTDSFKPYKPLSQFNGQSINGLWILKIYDRATGNTGTLNAWSLNFLIGTIPIGIYNISNEIPNGFSLSQNYPNPFNPTTNFEFRIADLGFVNIKIFDLTGKEVETLVNENLSAGVYKVNWNASKYSSGVYFCKLISADYSETKRMVLIK